MFANAFVGERERPTGEQLSAALGASRTLWDKLVEALSAECDRQEWHSYSPKAGWALRLKRGDRAIVYLSPGCGSFLASFALGDRAMAEARDLKLPAKTVKILAEAKRYAEGTAVRLEVKSAGDVAVVRKLAAVKMAN